MGQEQKAEYYDDFFKEGRGFDTHYKKSHYWVHWTQVIKFLGEPKSQAILEIGCGTGQLAEYLFDQGYTKYFGFDFSTTGIELSKKRVPGWKFEYGDALEKKYYPKKYDTAICLEVLEHVQNDIQILKNIKMDSIVIFSVPNFPAPSHVRRFLSERAIKKRYYKYIDIRSIVRVGNIFIVRGYRSDFRPTLLQSLFKSREKISSNSFIARIKYHLGNLFIK